MTGGDRSSYEERYRESSGTVSRSFHSDPSESYRGREERARHLTDLHSKVEERIHTPKPQRQVEQLIDNRYIRLTITQPQPGTVRVYVILIDNSGSNRVIAQHLRKAAGFMIAYLRGIDPLAEYLIIYTSDHGDGPRMFQPIDYFKPDEEGDKILTSSSTKIYDANGFDAPEAFECAMKLATELNFANATERHLFLITDEIGHGMGHWEHDDGCPDQVSWKESLRRVHEVFQSFALISCTGYKQMIELQKQFIEPERRPYDLVDLTQTDDRLRKHMVGTVLMFLIARGCGKQAVASFLGALYDKWMEEPIFGSAEHNIKEAQKAITHLSNMLEYQQGEIDDMLRVVFHGI